MDLDTLAWKPVTPPQRKPLDESKLGIVSFINSHPSWVIEGCYTDLLELAAPFSTEIIYLNLLIGTCIENARNRPWEPHKYESKEAQDRNLDMLVEWIAEYPRRDDTCSQAAHLSLYERYTGQKQMHTND